MWYDAFVVCILIASAWRGATKGAVLQLAVIASIVGCMFFASALTPRFEEQIPIQQPARHWVAVSLVYAGVSLVAFLLARQLRLWLEKVQFVEYDRHWGAILGLVKGAIGAAVLTCLVGVLVPAARPTLKDSTAGKATQTGVEQLAPLLPERLAGALQSAFNDEGADSTPDLRLPSSIEIPL